MTELKCSVSTCSYNAQNGCSKGDIKVEGKDSTTTKDTRCGSFKERTGDSFVNGMDRPEFKIDVSCEAEKCIYNNSMKCNAENIGIAGAQAKDVSQTECASFKAQ